MAIVIAVGVKRGTGEREVFVVGRWSQQGRLLLALVHARSLVARGLGGEAGNQRRPPGPQRSHRGGTAGCLVAEVPGALHEERPLFGARGDSADAGSYHMHRFRPTRCHRSRAVTAGSRQLLSSFLAACRVDRRGRGERAHLRGVSRTALAGDLVEQSSEESEQGDQEKDGGGRYLSQ